MTQNQIDSKQLLLEQLLKGGAFRFDPNIATVSYEEYKEIIHSIHPPENYSIGYDMSGVNWLENCFLDRDTQGQVEMIRRERTWQYGSMRAFQLELITVPKLIMITTEPETPNKLDQIWYCDTTGKVRAYIQTYNDKITENLRS